MSIYEETKHHIISAAKSLPDSLNDQKMTKEPLMPQEETPKHKRKRGRKDYGIEMRYIGKKKHNVLWEFYNGEWHNYWGKYETEKDRDEALKALQKKSTNGAFRDREFEYRGKK